MDSYCQNHPGHVETRGTSIVVVSCILGPLALIVFSARMWLRAVVQRNVDWSDWMMALGMLFTGAYIVEVCIAYKLSGLQYHICDLHGDQILVVLKHTFSVTMIAIAASFFIKASILLFYRRISESHPNKIFVYVNNAVFVFLVLTFIPGAIALFASCQPFDAFWNQYNPSWAATHKFHCINNGVYIIVFSAFYALLDIVITLMPTAMIWNMQLPRKQKVALWLLFSIGLASTVAAICRMVSAYDAFLTPAGVSDSTWNSWGTLFWTIVEYPVAIICASGPMLKALFKRYFDSSQTDAARTARTAHGTPELTIAPTIQRMLDEEKGLHAQASNVSSSSAPESEGGSASIALEPLEKVSTYELTQEVKHLQKKNHGWGIYRTTEASPLQSREDLAVTSATATSPPEGLWSPAIEMEMGRMLDAAGRMTRKRSVGR